MRSFMLLSLRKTIVFALLFLTASMSLYAADTNPSFRVMSFNVRYGSANDGENSWEYRCETLVDEIKENDPLMFGVQEAIVKQMDYISESLPEYAFVGVGRDDGAQGGEYCAVFYKKEYLDLLDSGTFWLSETPEKAGVKGWDAACNRVVSWGKFKCKQSGKEFVYANTHFDHMGQIARRNSAHLVLDRMSKIAGDLPWFISGDFNSSPDSEVYKILTNKEDGVFGLNDSRLIAKKLDIAQNRTFHDFGRIPADKGSIIDYIFVTDNISVEEFKISPDKRNGRFPSDHDSIVATLTL